MSHNYLSRYPFALTGKYNEIDVLNETMCRNSRAKSEMRERWMTNLDVDTGRYTREFLTPAPHQGMYYPRHELTGYLESASAHIPYLVRPMFNYKTNSKYGYSKLRQWFGQNPRSPVDVLGYTRSSRYRRSPSSSPRRYSSRPRFISRFHP